MLLLLLACQPDALTRALPDGPAFAAPPAATGGTAPGTPVTPTTVTSGTSGTTSTGGTQGDLLGWIGSPCDGVEDCPYEGAVCLPSEAGWPAGTCSLECTSSCPDEAGFPVTSCVENGALPSSAGSSGTCLSRCDTALYPGTGCRSGYGCARVGRADAALTDVYACLPGAASELGPCREELAARGVGFEPTVREDEHPADASWLTCHVEDPVWLISPVQGVELRYFYDDEPGRALVDCVTAHAVADMHEDVGPLGVYETVHVGTYTCRTISGSSSLSQHGLGKALDINGFTFDDGTRVTVLDHWEDGDATPDTWAGAFLHEAVHRWYDAWIWNIILTPEYNADHDNHFHVDMTDGSHALYLLEGEGPPHYLGPPPYGVMD